MFKTSTLLSRDMQGFAVRGGEDFHARERIPMIALPFLVNSLFNFAVGILVAKVLGPAEYGRYALALSVGVVLQTFGLDWLRLAATRYYSAQDRLDRPEVRATLDLVFLAMACLAAIVVGCIVLAGATLPLSNGLLALAVCAAVANGSFDISAALLRARFLDRDYALLVIVKNMLAAILVIGGAWYFCSAKVAIAGLVFSIVGSFVISRKTLRDANTGPGLADRKLAFKFAAYGIPIVLANVLYQTVPMVNRGVVSQTYGFAEAGEMAFAFEIGIRLVGSLGSALDVLLFQIAVLAERTFGEEAARSQISSNIGLVFAIVSPVVIGCWLVLPSFQYIFVPASFHGSFTHYFTLMLPALLAFALINYCVAPAFQISHKTLPLIGGGAVALLADGLALIVLPMSTDASRFAIAQSISSCAGLATIVLILCFGKAKGPRARDVLGACGGLLAMAAAVMPMRNAMAPGLSTMLLQALVGASVYVAIILAFDVCRLRELLLPRLRKMLTARGGWRVQQDPARVSDGTFP